MSAFEGGLRRSLQEAIRASRSRSLRVDGTGGGLRPVDWVRFLSGSALASPEIDGAVAIPRRLTTPDGDVALPAVPQWIRERRGRVVFLRADAGEGKTTYLGLMAAVLRDSAMALFWNPGADLTMDDVLDVTATVRSIHDPASTEPLPAVVLTELRPTLDESTARSMLSTLWDHESRADDTVFVIAGRPAAVDFLANRVGGAEICTLASVNQAEASALCERIQRAHDEVSKTLSAKLIAEQFPNLVSFLALPPGARAAYFSVPGQPLIIGFLKAVYGPDFVQRLVGEYRGIAETVDQRAYLHVCLTTVAGLDLSERILRTLVPAADLDARSRHDPWVRTERDDHVARHAVIAQTVLEGCKDYSMLQQCFEDWTELSRRQNEMVPLLFHVVAGVAHMKPLAIRDKRIVGSLRRRLMLVLGDDTTLLARLIAESGASPVRLFSWARLLHTLASTSTEDGVPLLTTIVGLYDAALDLASDRMLAERIEYCRDCGMRDLSAMSGNPESVDDLEERMVRWQDFMGREWAGPQFYADLFDTARQVAVELSLNRPGDQDSDPVYRAYVTSALAFVHMWSTDGQTYAKERLAASGELINRYLHYALPKRYVDVLKQAWDLVRTLHCTFGQAGVLYANALLESPNLGDRTDESRVDEAVSVLKEALELEPNTTDATYLLASLSLKRTDLIPFVRAGIDGNTSTNASEVATLHSAAALIEQDPNARRRHLEQAVETYARVEWTGRAWARLGKRWIDNCAELRRFGCHLAACGKVLERQRSRYQAIKR